MIEKNENKKPSGIIRVARFKLIVVLAGLAIGLFCVYSMNINWRKADMAEINRREADVMRSAEDVLYVTDKWIKLEINDIEMLRGLPVRIQRLQKTLGELKEPFPRGLQDEKRIRLLKLAYVSLSRNLSAYHCSRARLYSPDPIGGGACTPYDFDRTKAEIESLMKTPPGESGGNNFAEWRKAFQAEHARNNPKTSDRPNVIIIVIDTFRADFFHAPGAAPFMKQLAAAGLEFRDTVSCGSATHTSVASLLTGVNPLTHGMLDYAAWDNSFLVTPLFKNAGYRTAAFSANSVVARDMLFDSGFDSFTERYWGSADVLNLDVASYLYTELDPAQPQFMYIHYVDPHGPYFSPDKFNPGTGKVSPWPGAVIPGYVRDEFSKKGIDARTVVTDEQLQMMKDNYRDEIEYMDARLKDMFAVMRETGILENALVVITSDHGEEFLEHGGVKHSWTLYDEAIRVPLIFWGNIPGQWREKHDMNKQVSLLDVVPTLLDYTGIPAPDYLEGRHLFNSAPADFRASVTMGKAPGSFTQACAIGSAIKGNWKLISCPSQDVRLLFDISADPEETTDVSMARPDIAESLEKDLVSLERPADSSAPEENILTPEKLRQLKSLGYIE